MTPDKPYNNLKCDEIASRITEHLKKFAEKPQIYPISKLYNPIAFYRGGPRIMINYVSYQVSFSLTKAQAIQYLVWLDAGHVGKHYACFSGKN